MSTTLEPDAQQSSTKKDEVIFWSRDEDGVVVLTLDDPRHSVNTMSREFLAALTRVVDRLERERERISGVVIISAKETFFAGGDLRELKEVEPADAEEFGRQVRETKESLRRLETLGRPVVAAINGSALGGGLELGLAAHHRIAVDDAGIALGFPEVTLGLLPGAGGVTRSVRLLGVASALDELLLDGRRLDPEAAAGLGLVDHLVPTADELMPAARAWIRANPEAVQPWDSPGYVIPGGSAADPDFVPVALTLPSRLRKKLRGAPYAAPPAIVAAAVEGAQVDFDGASEIEGRYFVSLVLGQISKNMIQGLFFDIRNAGGGRRRDRSEGFQPTRVAVLGAGMMGAGIAWVCARAGVEVGLVDLDGDAARKGKAYSEKLVAKEVAQGRMAASAGEDLLARITPTADPADLEGAEAMIEAVFESPDVKAAVYAQVVPRLAEGALLASNTSTLPIGELAAHVSHPDRFVGMHFFSPVDRMELLEIIAGEATSVETVERALDLAKLLRKTPILVNDSRGFFTSRVITTYIDEGISMLLEGIPAPSIERASLAAGFPAGVLQLADELNLNLSRRIREENRAAREASGEEWTRHGAHLVVDRMLDEFDRAGRSAGAGFYEYDDGRRDGLWGGLDDAFVAGESPSLQDLSERLLFVEAIEAVKCLEEGVVESVADANVGSVLGIGFPRWTGGVLQYVNGYEGGLEGFIRHARVLEERYSDRFRPPQMLLEKAGAGEVFLDSVPAP